MNMRDIRTWEFTSKANAHRHDHSHTDHAHFWQRAMSRRQFARAVAGTAVVGAGLGAGLWRPGLAMAHRSHKHRSHEPSPSLEVSKLGVKPFTCWGPGLTAIHQIKNPRPSPTSTGSSA